MPRSLLGIAVALAFLSPAGPAMAQSWPICFEGEANPTAEAYRAIREGAAAFRDAGRFRAAMRLQRRSDAPDLAAETRSVHRLNEAYIELLRAGVPASYLRTEEVPTLEAPPGCLVIQMSVTPPGEAPGPPLLWHLRGVYFSPGSTEIDAGGRFWIRVAAALNEPGRARYLLDGHSDTLGTPEDNLALSRRRANAVAEGLVREGVAWDQIEAEGYGETRLARPTEDEVAEPLNRRVWIDMRYRTSAPH